MKRLAQLSRSFAVARRFLPEVSGHGLKLAGVAGLYLAAILLELGRPWPLRWVIDDVLAPSGSPPANSGEIILYSGLALAAILAGKALLEYLATMLVAAIGHRVTRGLRLRVFRHMVGLSPDFHAKHRSGDLLLRLTGDVPMVKDMLVDAGVQMSVRGIQAIGIAVMLFVVDPVLAASVLLPLPLIALVVRFLSNHLRIAVRKQRRKEGELASYMHEAIEATVLLQALGREDHAIQRFARTNRTSARAGLKVARASARLGGAVEGMLALAFAGAMTFGAWRVHEGMLRLGELTVFLSYVRGLLKPIRAAAKHQARIAKGTACGERILRVLDEVAAIPPSAPGAQPPERPETLVFEGVHYTYADGTEALRGVDLRLLRGELAALVGPSGAGKSTLIALALRIFDPDQGEVRLGGIPLRELDLDAMREGVAISLQNTILFGESLRENLLLGSPEATEEELWAALEAAAAADIVRAQPEGLDALLGSGGVGLSGGEARRICLARALLRNADILIVDEPFGGLDRATALRLVETLRAAARDRIVLVVTHAVEHLEAFDRVVHLDRGRILGDGRHVDLLAGDRQYSRLVGEAQEVEL